MSVTLFIALRTVAAIMCLAVDLDRQPHCETGKIQGVMVQRKLLPKPESARSLSQLLPEQHFG